MVTQDRAKATRQRILDAAVDLFSERGYGETGLNGIIERTGLSKGAFYYHFSSKEDVAAAIVEEYQRLGVERWPTFDPAGPVLAQLTRATFESLLLLHTNKYWQVGQDFVQSLNQLGTGNHEITAYWTAQLFAVMELARAAGELRPEVDTAHTAQILEGMYTGAYVVSRSTEIEPFTVAQRYAVLFLRSVAPAEAMAGYEQFCADLAAEFIERLKAFFSAG